ncbi:MAG: response regulator [Candidatus Omnitrophota bacterium]
MRKSKIIIIEDDEVLSEELSHVLSEAGYAVDIALDCYRAQELLKKKDYSVVLLDLKIPGSGKGLFEELKKRTNTNVFIITGCSVSQAERKFFAFAKHIFIKPFGIECLISEITKNTINHKKNIKAKIV